jgi:hypothetical protein
VHHSSFLQQRPWQLRLLSSGNSGALTVMAVKTLASVVAVATTDGNGDSDGSQNRVSSGSGSDSGYGGGRQEQKLQGQATINKMWQVALVAAETAAMAAAIVAARVQWQAGAAAWWKP